MHNATYEAPSSVRRKRYVLDEEMLLDLHERYNLHDISLILEIPYKPLHLWAKRNNISDEKFVDCHSYKSILACRNALGKSFEYGSITVAEYEQVKNECIRLMYEDNLNPRQVCSEYLKLDKSYHQFLSLCMGIQLKNFSASQKAYHHRIGTYDNMDEKERYNLECSFKFSDNLLPYLLSHPANCMIMPHPENNNKRARCSITVNELIERVEWFNETLLYKASKNETSLQKDLAHCAVLAAI